MKNENKALTKMVAELKIENGCLRKMSYAHKIIKTYVMKWLH